MQKYFDKLLAGKMSDKALLKKHFPLVCVQVEKIMGKIIDD